MNLRQAANRLYTTPPAFWLSRLSDRFRRRFPESPAQAQRRDREEAQRGARRPAIQRLVERVRAGEAPVEALTRLQFTASGGMAAEYGFFAAWLLKREPGQNLLDVGCLLRNRFTASLLRERCAHVWHCGPAFHDDALDRTEVNYNLLEFARSFPDGEEFPMVVCLSMLEHIGYAAPRQGRGAPQALAVPSLDPVAGVLKNITKLTASGGRILLSVPFGTAEVRASTRESGLAEQVFDRNGLSACLAILEECGIPAAAALLYRGESGWEMEEAGHTSSGIPQTASGVAFIEGTREG